MCRLLAVKSRKSQDIGQYLKPFAAMAKFSKEYQGHGWGVASFSKKWTIHKEIIPIWESNHSNSGSSHLFLAHARSAFQNADIKIENNMPFTSNGYVFIFNGEISNVKLNIPGKIGAEKLFNLILRMGKSSIEEGIAKAIKIIEKRSDYIRAMNFILSDGTDIYICNYYNEDLEYFQLYIHKSADGVIISSNYILPDLNWRIMKNKSIEKL